MQRNRNEPPSNPPAVAASTSESSTTGAMTRSARLSMPLTTVLPPIAAVLEDIQSVVAVEAKRLRKKQSETGTGISVEEAKALGTLTTALIQSEKAKSEFGKVGLSDMTDEQLEPELARELEEVRARLGKKS